MALLIQGYYDHDSWLIGFILIPILITLIHVLSQFLIDKHVAIEFLINKHVSIRDLSFEKLFGLFNINSIQQCLIYQYEQEGCVSFVQFMCACEQHSNPALLFHADLSFHALVFTLQKDYNRRWIKPNVAFWHQP